MKIRQKESIVTLIDDNKASVRRTLRRERPSGAATRRAAPPMGRLRWRG